MAGIPDPDEAYSMAGCDAPRCGLPRGGAGRVPAGWIQIHYAPAVGVHTEPDRWYCTPQCAARGLVHADIVASRTDAVDAAVRAERAAAALADIPG